MAYFLILGTPIFAQKIIKGQVLDDTGLAISDVSISYGKGGANVIIGFTRSDSNGNFSLGINETTDSISLKFACLGYGNRTVVLKNENQTYKIVLKPKFEQLKPVLITASPIYKKNDTINYNVNAFTSKQDRVIGDIIKKLPGVEIQDGKIFYQGKPIQKYYINGLDLLEGKYGLANDNLPVDAVQKVQIIENNQPIKILDSLIFSDRASLNIKLKKLTTTGTAKLGVGLLPFIRDIGVTPMVFAKNFQTINTFQSNNIGEDSRNQIQNFDTPDILDIGSSLATNSNPLKLLVRDISSPPFLEKRWLDNNINMFSTNMLKKLDNKLELKGSITYVNNTIKRDGRNDVSLFTPTQQIFYVEQIDNSYHSNYLGGNFTILKNEKRVYLKNILNANVEKTDDVGNILRDQSLSIYQQKKMQTTDISNRFSIAKLVGKQLVTFGSLITYLKAPEDLLITPNPFPTLITTFPRNVTQHVEYSNFNNENYVSFIKSYGRISILPKLGVSYQKQVLKTGNGSSQSLNPADSLVNDLTLITLQGYLDTKIQYNSENLKLDFTIPFFLRKFDVRNVNLAVSNESSRIVAEPRITGQYKLSSGLKINAGTGYKKQFSDIGMLYTSLVVNSYQEVRKYNGSINQSDDYYGRLALEYTDPVSAVFADFTFSNDSQKKNYIFKNQIDANGFNTIDILNLPNWMISNTLDAGLSKYFLDIKTLAKLRAGANFASSYFLFGDILQRLKTELYSLTLDVDNTFFDKFNINYKSKFSFLKNQFLLKSSSNIFINQQTLELNFFPNQNNTFTLNGEYYISNEKQNSNQLFIDARYRFSFTKPKVDFEINAINLLNTISYNQLYSQEYTITQSSFNLRKRQVLLTMRFRF